MSNSASKSTFRLAVGSSVAALALVGASEAIAQSAEEDTIDTAKAADTVSPYGVSYATGSFTYSVPLFTIGHGEWPNKVTVSLDYDSSGRRYPNKPWTISIARRMSGLYTQYITGFEGDPIEELHRYGLNVVLGNSKQEFDLGGPTLDPASFRSVSENGSSVDFAALPPGYYFGRYLSFPGDFTVTGRDGTTLEFLGGLRNSDGPLQIHGPATLTLPDGTEVDYSDAPNLGDQMVSQSSSSGLIVRKYGSEICAFNTAYIDASTITDCSQSPLVATIVTQPGVYELVTSVTRPDGGTFNFEYQSYTTTHNAPGGMGPNSTGTREHLSCVKEPGQSVCAVSNTYDPCDGPGFGTNQGGWYFQDSEWSGSRDRVIRQDLADGRIITYSYAFQADPCQLVSAVTMSEGSDSTEVKLVDGVRLYEVPGPVSVKDPLQRVTEYTWTGDAIGTTGQFDDKLATVTSPDDNSVEYSYDSRGNRTETRIKAKPGSGLADIVTTATYPATCTHQKTCNKPTSVTDAEGNTTTFTYDAAHGGVLTEQGPSVGGVVPATKYYYVQREAWLKSGSGYAKSGVPTWLLSETRACRTTSMNLANGTCAGGTADLVRTTYDYGPDSGPNNLWLRGTAAIADGQTLRTCFSYDDLGRRVSETQPKAGLTSCP